MTTSVFTDWVRPWYPAGLAGHIYPSYPDLLLLVPEPSEGPGWLDPRQGEVCEACLYMHDPKIYAELFPEDEEA